jgi:hypothetical protein
MRQAIDNCLAYIFFVFLAGEKIFYDLLLLPSIWDISK